MIKNGHQRIKVYVVKKILKYALKILIGIGMLILGIVIYWVINIIADLFGVR